MVFEKKALDKFRKKRTNGTLWSSQLFEIDKVYYIVFDVTMYKIKLSFCQYKLQCGALWVGKVIKS